jgi:hypothetical protein
MTQIGRCRRLKTTKKGVEPKLMHRGRGCREIRAGSGELGWLQHEDEADGPYSSFGIGVDRMHSAKWHFHQKMPPFNALNKSTLIPKLL